MKKSFLKRAMAAAIAVPVALTQTVMFASFAETEENTASGDVITMDSFTKILFDEKTIKTNVADYKGAVANEDVNVANAIVQESKWNTKATEILDGLMDQEIKLDTAKLSDSIKSTAWYADMLKEIINGEKTSAVAKITSSGVKVTITVDTDLTAMVVDEATRSLAQEYQDATLDIESTAKVTGTIVIDLDTESLGDKTLSAKATVNLDGLKKGDITKTSIEYARELIEKAKADITGAVVDAGLDASVLDGKFDRYDNLINKAESGINKAEDLGSKSFQAKDADELWTKARDFAIKKAPSKGQKIPATIADAQATKPYSTASDIMADVIDQLSAKSSAHTFDITLDDVVSTVQDVYDITANVEAMDFVTKADGVAYMDDDEFDGDLKQSYVDYFNSKLDGVEVVEVYSVKVVEAAATADERNLTAEGTLNIYRVVWYDETKEIETTTTESDKIEESSSTASDEAENPSESTSSEDVSEATEESTEATEESTEATDATEESTEATDATEETTEETEESTEATEETGETLGSEETTTSENGEDNTDETTETQEPGRTDVVVKTKGGFYFSHDPRAFSAENLIESATVKTVDADGEETEVAADMSKFSFKFYQTLELTDAEEADATSPKSAYADDEINTMGGYVAAPIFVYYEGQLVAKAQANVCIGVKGDANLDGSANASDAAIILMFAAQQGTGKEVNIYSEYNDELDRLAYFLADTTGESEDRGKHNAYGESKSNVDASDAAQVLMYSAMVGASKNPNWVPDVIKATAAPKYSKEIAEAAGLIG